MNNFNMTSSTYDLMGMFISFLCLLHCLALPLLAIITPSFAMIFEQEWIHLLLLAALIPIALFSFIKGKIKHKSNSPLFVGLVGTSLLIAAVFAEQMSFMNIKAEVILTTIGSLILLSGHVINIKHSLKI